ncbi:NAD(P)H-binding protein [Arthrobacter sp. ISL-48]|nr:NAD(P)H-binding protein [Arthrobacter sp. ISL-48]
MNPRPSTVLIIGATGSIGRHAVAEALHQGYAVRALVRDPARAARVLPEGVDLVVGDLTRPKPLVPPSTASRRSSSHTAQPPVNVPCGITTTPASPTSLSCWAVAAYISHS